MDRRYTQARGAGGSRASNRPLQVEAYARAQARLYGNAQEQALKARDPEDGRTTGDPQVNVNAVRGYERRGSDLLFNETGSGAFGADASKAEARKIRRAPGAEDRAG